MIASTPTSWSIAHRSESLAPRPCSACGSDHLAEGSIPWALPVSCIGEFVRIATHRASSTHLRPISQALDAVDALLESPSVRLLAPTQLHWPLLRAAIIAGETYWEPGRSTPRSQPICREHGVDRILTEDRDFGRFPFLQIVTLAKNLQLEAPRPLAATGIVVTVCAEPAVPLSSRVVHCAPMKRIDPRDRRHPPVGRVRGFGRGRAALGPHVQPRPAEGVRIRPRADRQGASRDSPRGRSRDSRASSRPT